MKWKLCESFPTYEVSECGDVRRARDRRLRKSAPNTAGYACYGLWRDGKQKTVQASHLVAEAFLDPKPFDEAQVCHNDGTRTNDHYSNLRWDTVKGNAADRLVHGTETLGEKNGQAKLTDADVVAIRLLKTSGKTQSSIAQHFGVSDSRISDIVNNKRWTHVS